MPILVHQRGGIIVRADSDHVAVLLPPSGAAAMAARLCGAGVAASHADLHSTAKYVYRRAHVMLPMLLPQLVLRHGVHLRDLTQA